MKEFQNQAAQGDLLIRRIDKLPADAKETERKDEMAILAHSETGHHHAILAPKSDLRLFSSNNPLVGYMEVNADDVQLKHYRNHDTHETLAIGRGVYEIRRQREAAPNGWQTVQD